MHRTRPIIATVVVLLLASGGSTVAASVLTATLQEARLAEVSYESALATAQSVRDDAAESRELLLDAILAGRSATTEAAAIEALPAGLLDATAVAAIPPLTTGVSELLPEKTPAAFVAESVGHPEAAADLREAAGLLLDWSLAAQGAADAIEEDLASITNATTALRLAIADVARSVSASSTAALGSAPLASAETRAAIAPAVTAVREALRTGSSTATALQGYSTAVSALAASQVAAAAKAAVEAAEREANDRRPFTPPPITRLNCDWNETFTEYACQYG